MNLMRVYGFQKILFCANRNLPNPGCPGKSRGNSLPSNAGSGKFFGKCYVRVPHRTKLLLNIPQPAKAISKREVCRF